MGTKGKRGREIHKQSFADELLDPATRGVREKPRSEKRRRRMDEEDEGDVPEDLARKIMDTAGEQQREVREAEGHAQGETAEDKEGRDLLASALRRQSKRAEGAWGAERAPMRGAEPDSGSEGGWSGDEGGEEEVWEEVAAGEEAVTEDDKRALEAFMAGNTGPSRSLADVVLAKIREQQARAGLEVVPEDADAGYVAPGIDAKVAAVYRGVGEVLSRYTTGKVPKAFKVVPSLSNWEEVLLLTDPEGWSPHAVYAATRLFASNLNARMAQRFYSLVLLPRFRREIRDTKKIHFAVFQALKKAFYKPAAMYKGVLLPLCQSRTCTLREAVVLSAALKRVHVPVLHSAAALLRLAEMEYGGTTSFFIRVLLEKKYALPYRVIDALVEHFARFERDERQLPVVWHQSLLTFVQRYKNEIRLEDKEKLRRLCRVQYHYQVTPEVVRELNQSGARGVPSFAVGSSGAAWKPSLGGKRVAEDVSNLPPVLIMERD